MRTCSGRVHDVFRICVEISRVYPDPSDLDSLEISRPSKQRSGASADGNTKHSPRSRPSRPAPEPKAPNCHTSGDETQKRVEKKKMNKNGNRNQNQFSKTALFVQLILF